jgi:hypothetical protein
MKKFGKELIFISQIERNGSGVDTDLSEEYLEQMKDVKFKVRTLSLGEKTFIASEFNSFVVKLK